MEETGLNWSAWKFLLSLIQTMAVVCGTFIFSVLKLANPNYNKSTQLDYIENSTEQTIYKGQTTQIPTTDIGITVRNSGLGIGKITRIEVANVEGSIDGSKENINVIEGGKEGHRLFPMQQINYLLRTDRFEDIEEIDIYIHDEKLGRSKIRLNSLSCASPE